MTGDHHPELVELLPPEEVVELLPPEELVELLPPEEVVELLPPEELVELLPPEELLLEELLAPPQEITPARLFSTFKKKKTVEKVRLNVIIIVLILLNIVIDFYFDIEAWTKLSENQNIDCHMLLPLLFHLLYSNLVNTEGCSQ